MSKARKTTEKDQFSLIVAYGEVDFLTDIMEGKKAKTINLDSGRIVRRSFASKEELNAYKLALDDHSRSYENYPLSGDEITKYQELIQLEYA